MRSFIRDDNGSIVYGEYLDKESKLLLRKELIENKIQLFCGCKPEAKIEYRISIVGAIYPAHNNMSHLHAAECPANEGTASKAVFTADDGSIRFRVRRDTANRGDKEVDPAKRVGRDKYTNAIKTHMSVREASLRLLPIVTNRATVLRKAGYAKDAVSAAASAYRIAEESFAVKGEGLFKFAVFTGYRRLKDSVTIIAKCITYERKQTTLYFTAPMQTQMDAVQEHVKHYGYRPRPDRTIVCGYCVNNVFSGKGLHYIPISGRGIYMQGDPYAEQIIDMIATYFDNHRVKKQGAGIFFPTALENDLFYPKVTLLGPNGMEILEVYSRREDLMTERIKKTNVVVNDYKEIISEYWRLVYSIKRRGSCV